MFDALRAERSGGTAQFRIGVTRGGDNLSATVADQAGQAHLRGGSRYLLSLRPFSTKSVKRSGRSGSIGLETVAVDGKVLRGSGSGESVAVTVIGAMAQDGALVAQQRVADKSNEIPALAPLLSELDLQGVVVTADALHTQVETAKVLVEEMGAHFVLVVKRNRPALWEACRSIPWSEVTARHKQSEVGHGRIETRVVQAVTWTSLAFPHVFVGSPGTAPTGRRASGRGRRST